MALFPSCNKPIMGPHEATKWIAAYSPERLDMNSTIRIEPTRQLYRTLDSCRTDNKIFSFSPSVKGEVRYVNSGQYIDFVPSQPLKQDTEYTCRMNMSKLTGIDSLPDFQFNFIVEKRELKIETTKVRIDPNNVEQIIIDGTITFSTPPNSASTNAELISCDNNAVIKIIPTDDKLCHRFEISNIRRRSNDYQLAIKYKGVDGFCGDTTEATIPGIKEFKLLSVERVEASTPYIDMEFSAPLASEQELDGLITIEGIDDLRIEKNGTNVRVYYEHNGLTNLNFFVSELIRRADGCHLEHNVSKLFLQEVIPPAVEIPIKGTILPDNNNLTLPFKAVNLAAVDVEVVKIYTNNVMRHLQEYDINESYQLRRVGRLIYRKTVRLDDDPNRNLHEWQNFSVDLKNLFRQERGAIYNVRLTFRQAYSLYNRTERNGELQFELSDGVTDTDNAHYDKDDGYYYSSRKAPDYNWSEYSWSDINDPNKPSYYMDSDRMPDYNLVASNIGLIAKSSDDTRLWTTVTNIMTATPMQGVRVTAYNRQLQVIGHGITDARGFADFNVANKPFIVTATDGVSTSYLKLESWNNNSLTNFNVAGKVNTKGIKGFIYGERGVWRPGDEIHLTLLVEDKLKALPANHPVSMDFYTPEGRLYEHQSLTKGIDGFYAFHIQTGEDVPTGRWNAVFKVGGSTFEHPVKIETIKPNRIKIAIKTDEILQAPGKATCSLDAHWLTGPAAGNLSTALEMVLYNNTKPFEDYANYTFANPLCVFSTEHIELTKGSLDSLGHMTTQIELAEKSDVPGLLQANIIARVREAGGDESFAARSVRYSPYSAYVGIKLDDRDYETDTDISFPVVSVDAHGKPLSNQSLEYKIYKLDWSWWWEGDSFDLKYYVQSTSAEVVAEGTVQTTNGVGQIPFRIEYPTYGKYLVFVRNTVSGHATGGTVYIDWPDWRGHAGKADPKASSLLSFALDKKNYSVGENATVYLPKSDGGRVLLSVENASRVVSRQWVNTSANRETAFKIPVTKDMTPNFYVHATLLQPHKKSNDLPIRMYGVEGADVIDRQTILHPEIDIADEIQPQQEFTVRIRERDHKPMTYTLAIVDEGLLDITSFRTPEPWRFMNQREALGVKTWDLYDDVINAYAGKFTKVLSVGGDEALRRAAGKEKRFNPIVKFMGPFTLKGGQATHRITLPMYVGSVRVMVVAAHEGSYGNADKTVPVRSPLMLLPTLPRVLSCGDRVKLPVNVLRMNKQISNASIKVIAEGPVAVVGRAVANATFASQDEQLIMFDLACDDVKSGQAKITVMAEGGKYKFADTVYIDVRNPLPPEVTTVSKTLLSGEKHTFAWTPFSDGTTTLEAASIDKIDFSGAFSFVEHYSHYCTEQLSARAMYMLYARQFLSADEQARAKTALPYILKTILSRQLVDGGFAYWPGSSVSHEWASSMAGEVMIEARRQGFAVFNQTISRWQEYQKNRARAYKHNTDQAQDLIQAYRLYTLVKSGYEPTAAMNRLRESKQLSRQALMRLVAAYAEVGKTDVARQLVKKIDFCEVKPGAMFGSELRDKAMELETWALVNNHDMSLKLTREIASEFSSAQCNTQEVAFVSAAMHRMVNIFSDTKADVVIRPKYSSSVSINGINGVRSLKVKSTDGAIDTENTGDKSVHMSLTTVRQRKATEPVKAEAKEVEIDIHYTDFNSNKISFENLSQGAEFYAHIVVKKLTHDSKSLALTYAIPSGWEIWNDRLIADNASVDDGHTDIRDDRINWYFNLRAGKSIEFKVRLRAAYCGHYLMPPTVCEDMYDSTCRTTSSSRFVDVVK